MVCLSWVNSFTGSVLQLDSIGQLCREKGVLFVVNGSQGVGALDLDVAKIPIDALVSCGYKWLCGPYGTGFCWIRPELRDELRPTQTYWLPQVWGEKNLNPDSYTLKHEKESTIFDVFCPAIFFNSLPWLAAIDLLLGIGIANIEQHNHTLSELFINGLSRSKYRLLSPHDRRAQSSIIAISHVAPDRNAQLYAALTDAGIDAALRDNNLRFALHIYNTPDEVDRATSLLNRLA